MLRISDHLHRVHRLNKQDLLDFPRHLSETNGPCRVRILRRVSSSHDLNEMLRGERCKTGFSVSGRVKEISSIYGNMYQWRVITYSMFFNICFSFHLLAV